MGRATAHGSAPTGRGTGGTAYGATAHGTGPRVTRGAVAAAAVGALALTLSSCGNPLGSDDKTDSHRKVTGERVTVGLLLPERETVRYEKFDRPVVEQQVKELTHGKGTVRYANAEGSAAKQAQQFQKMTDEGVDSILVDAVDAASIAPEVRKAKDAGINVIAYDRLAEGPVDGYVTFDGDLVGQVQGRSLMEAAGGSSGKPPKIVMINGDPADPNSAVFKRGALSELSSRATIAKSYDTKGWSTATAQSEMAAAIKKLGAQNIDGVYSANDGMAGGIIKALRDAGVSPLPPVTGQDADLDAVQRILTGDQYMSVYKPYRDEAAGAAEMAVKIAEGKTIQYASLALNSTSSKTTKDIPTRLVQVEPLTKKSIKSTVIKDRIWTEKEICTPEYVAACRAAGIDG